MQLESLVIPLVLNTAGILGAGAIIKGIVDATSGAVKSTMELANSFDDLSDKLGISVENAARWVSTSKTVGLSTDQLSKGMNFLTKNIAGNDKVFSKYNITLRNNDGTLRKTEDIVQDVAREYNKLPDGVEKTNMAMELFGSRIGPEMHDWLQRIESQAQYTREQLVLMGIVIEEDVTANWEQFGFSVNFLNQQLTGLGVVFSNKLQPALMDFVNWMSQILQSEDFLLWWDTLTTKIGEFATGFVNGIKGLWDYLQTFKGLNLGDIIGKVSLDVSGLWVTTLRPALIKMFEDAIRWVESGGLTDDINLMIASIINALSGTINTGKNQVSVSMNENVMSKMSEMGALTSFYDLGTRLVTAIWTGISEADWESLRIVLSAKLQEIANAVNIETKDNPIIGWLKTIFWSVTGFNAVGLLGSVIKQIGLYNMFQTTAKATGQGFWKTVLNPEYFNPKAYEASWIAKLANFVKGIFTSTKWTNFLTGLSGIGGFFSGIWSWITTTMIPAIGSFLAWLGGLVGATGTAAVAVGAVIAIVIAALIAGAIWVAFHWEETVAFFKEASDNIGRWWKSTTEGVSKWWNESTSSMKLVWDNFWRNVKLVFDNTITNIKLAYTGFKTWISVSFINPVVNTFSTFGKNLANAFGSGFSNAKTFAITIINDIIRAYNSIAFLPDLGYLPVPKATAPSYINAYMASGGIATGGMTLVGERGPELVNLPAGSKVYNANASASKQQTEMQALIQELRDSRIDYNAFARVLRDQLVLVGG